MNIFFGIFAVFIIEFCYKFGSSTEFNNFVCSIAYKIHDQLYNKLLLLLDDDIAI